MGTKNNPGPFDCYTKAAPDEPIFVLLGRDRYAAEVIRYWIFLRHGGLPLGFLSAITDDVIRRLPEKQNEALKVARSMDEWRSKLNPTDAPGL